MWREGNPFALLVGMQTGAATVKNRQSSEAEIFITIVYISKLDVQEVFLKRKF